MYANFDCIEMVSVTKITEEDGIIILESTPLQGTSQPNTTVVGTSVANERTGEKLLGQRNSAICSVVDLFIQEVRPGAREESASPAWLTTYTINARDLAYTCVG